MKHKKYTQELKDKIVDLYNSGVSISKLSEECGAAKATIKKWLVEKNINIPDDNILEIITRKDFLDNKLGYMLLK